MDMARLFLATNTLLFLGFGTYAFLNPDLIQSMMGASEMSSAGIYEIRSNYGGVSIGIGLMCLAASLNTSLQRPALFVLMAYTGGYALGRVLALPLDGIPPPNLVGYAIYEAVNATLAALLLQRLSQAT